MRVLLVLFLLTLHAVVLTATDIESTQSPAFRLQKTVVPGGAELLTVFGRSDQPSEELPLFAVLRDTLGDSNPENDRLRYLWTFTAASPAWWQRAAGAMPFLYFRPASRKSGDQPPSALLDLTSSGRRFWRDMLALAIQHQMFDPRGLAVRASTRAYRENSGDVRSMHLMSVLAALSRLEGGETLSDREVRQVMARLALSERLLGGFVGEHSLDRVSSRLESERSRNAGRNWEILRQQAEAHGLWFDPLALEGEDSHHALVWIRREDLAQPRMQPSFQSRFLKIRNPWTDPRLRDWQGYTEIRYFDEDSRRVTPETPGARAFEMIPLALYSLDHPKAPLLMVDLRDSSKPKRREMTGRFLNDVARNVIGLTYYSNWYYMAGQGFWNFVRGRRGAPIDPSARLRAYAHLKLFLNLDESLDPGLRQQLSKRLNRVSVNPMENDSNAEMESARRQYKGLLAHAEDPNGLARRLDRDRRGELSKSSHSRMTRGWLRAANIASLNLYHHREDHSPDFDHRLDLQRRIDLHQTLLTEILSSGPQPEVTWNVDVLRRSVAFLAAESRENPEAPMTARSIRLLGEISNRTQDTQTRAASHESVRQPVKNIESQATAGQ